MKRRERERGGFFSFRFFVKKKEIQVMKFEIETKRRGALLFCVMLVLLRKYSSPLAGKGKKKKKLKQWLLFLF